MTINRGSTSPEHVIEEIARQERERAEDPAPRDRDELITAVLERAVTQEFSPSGRGDGLRHFSTGRWHLSAEPIDAAEQREPDDCLAPPERVETVSKGSGFLNWDEVIAEGAICEVRSCRREVLRDGLCAGHQHLSV